MSARDALKQIIAKESVLKGGTYRLSSGGTSPILIDLSKALRTLDGYAALKLCVAGLPCFENIDAVGGPLTGSDPLSFAVMDACGIRNCFGVRKDIKGRGFDVDYITGNLLPNSRVVLVDDVITTGGNTLRVAKEVIKAGALIKCVFCVVDRGGMACVEQELGVPGISLFKLSDFL